MKNPKVTVLMSVYNGEKYLKKAVDSILKQTFKGFEFLIINDGSSDSTAQILKSYKDPRIKIIDNEKNMGLTISLNKALRLARGEYIARQDADDISLPRRLEIQVEFLDKDPDCALVGCAYYKIDENGELCSLVEVLSKDSDIRGGLRKQNWFGHGCIMMRKDTVQVVGGYDEKYKFAQDYNLWLRIAEAYKVANIEEPLYCWRSTPSSISKDKEAEQKYYANLAVSDAKKREEQKILKENTTSTIMVSVIVPTYNRPDMLMKTIISILKQSYHNFEIIVVNDAGIDVKSKIKLMNKNNNIRYLAHTENKGLAAARNTGIKEAKGKYIAYLDDDDIYYPDHLETLVNFLENSDYKVAYTDAQRVHLENENGEYIVTKRDLPYSFDFNYDQILIDNFIPILCLMHERSCLNEVGLFDEELSVLEDWDLLIRLSRKFKFFHIKKETCKFVWKIDGTTMSSGKKYSFFETYKIIYEKHREYSRNKPHVIETQRDMLSGFLITCLEHIQSIYSSRSWRIGKVITAPWRSLKKLFRINKRI